MARGLYARPERSAAQQALDAAFIALWNAERPTSVIAQRLGFTGPPQVWRYAKLLRRRGVALAVRRQGRRGGPRRTGRAPYAGLDATGVPLLIPSAHAAPATLYDARGHCIGTMSALTRERSLTA